MFDTLKYFLACYLFWGFLSVQNYLCAIFSIFSCLYGFHMSTVMFLSFSIKNIIYEIGFYFQNSVMLIWSLSDANLHIAYIYFVTTCTWKNQVRLVLSFLGWRDMVHDIIDGGNPTLRCSRYQNRTASGFHDGK